MAANNLAIILDDRGEAADALVYYRQFLQQHPDWESRFNLASFPGGVSGLGLVRSLLPRRSAKLSIEQQGDEVVATVKLVPPGITKLEPA